MDYRQAQNIRNKSFGTLLAEQEGGAFSSLRKTISLKSKARATRIKQTFDPMNIAKFLTFGSNWAPAMLGKATGRSRESIDFFSGVNRGRRASVMGERSTRIPQLQSTGGFSKTLEKIYVLMKKSLDDERKRRQIQNNYKEENDIEKLDRHKELIEAITGKPYSGKATAVKLKSEGGFSLSDLLGGADVAKTLLSVLRWFASPVGLALLGATSMVALIALISFGLKKLAENTANMKALSPEEAYNVLQSGSAGDIEKLGGREKLEDIIKNGRQLAKEALDMEEGDAKKKLLLEMGGREKVQKIADDEKVYEVPPQRSDADLGLKESVASKADFIAGKPGTGGSKLAYGVRASAWDQRYGENYNEDGTRKTATPIPQGTTESPATPAAPMASGGTESSTQLNGSPAAKAEPMETPNAGSKLNAVNAQNVDLNLPQSTSDPVTSVKNTTVNSDGGPVPPKKYLPAVRNMEPSFQKMLLGSTRIV
jgi:hypothetical protein